MAISLKDQPLKRPPVYRNIHITNLTTYRLPPAGWVSILHRVSGAVLFLLLPFSIWMFDTSVSSDIGYDQFTSFFAYGTGLIPGWFYKLIAFGLIWAFVFHFISGLRHLYMDFTHAVGQAFGRNSAWVTLGLSSLLALALGAKLFF